MNVRFVSVLAESLVEFVIAGPSLLIASVLLFMKVAGAEQEVLEAETATTRVIDGIGAGATQIANGFVGGFGDVDGDWAYEPPLAPRQ